MSQINHRYIDFVGTLREIEKSFSGKTSEMAHAMVYAYQTGRMTSKVEDKIRSNFVESIEFFCSIWDGCESTYGALKSVTEWEKS